MSNLPSLVIFFRLRHAEQLISFKDFWLPRFGEESLLSALFALSKFLSRPVPKNEVALSMNFSRYSMSKEVLLRQPDSSCYVNIAFFSFAWNSSSL